MPATYEPIATTTLGSAASTITFSSIPATYTDIRLVVTALANTGTVSGTLRFNSDTATNYSFTRLIGSGSSATSSKVSSLGQMNVTWGFATTTIPMLFTVDVFSYAGSTNKTSLTTESSDANGSGSVSRFATLWRSTAAINRIDITTNSADNFATGTTATLYGILKA